MTALRLIECDRRRPDVEDPPCADFAHESASEDEVGSVTAEGMQVTV
jgi:hypothetical protein